MYISDANFLLLHESHAYRGCSGRRLFGHASTYNAARSIALLYSVASNGGIS